jgi:hypothetical protein
MNHNTEIARQVGTEFRSVYLRLEDDGGIKMDAQDRPRRHPNVGQRRLRILGECATC